MVVEGTDADIVTAKIVRETRAADAIRAAEDEEAALVASRSARTKAVADEAGTLEAVAGSVQPAPPPPPDPETAFRHARLGVVAVIVLVLFWAWVRSKRR